MSVAQVVNCGEKLNDCGCASKCKWEWVSVEVEVKAWEEVKKEHVGTWFHDVSYLYFHKNSLIFSPFLSGGGHGMPFYPLVFRIFPLKQFPFLFYGNVWDESWKTPQWMFCKTTAVMTPPVTTLWNISVNFCSILFAALTGWTSLRTSPLRSSCPSWPVLWRRRVGLLWSDGAPVAAVGLKWHFRPWARFRLKAAKRPTDLLDVRQSLPVPVGVNVLG